MGESACLMHSFSYVSGISNEAKQGNPMHALGDSISFGRFMSESLSWEKWSTFSHKRYVEEAERYAQPGSVAQKKAFFEAHYKSIAAKKAAALLEQANANAANIHPEPEFETHDSQSTIVNGNGYNSNVELEIGEVKVANTVVTGHEVQNESLKHSMVSEMDIGESPQMEKPLLEGLKSKHMVSEMELGESPQMKKPLLEGLKSNHEVPSLINKKKKQEISSSKSVVSITPLTGKSTIESMDKNRSTSKSLKKLIYSTSAKESDNKSAAPEFSSSKPAVHQRVPKVPAATGRRIESSRVAPSPYKASKDCKTPLRTPIVASANGVSKHPSTTPCSEIRRNRTPLDPSASGSKTTGPKWHLLSAVCAKSLTACRNKLQSPTLSTPFSLRTEERAARRKQKLEEKFNAKDTQKVQLQTRLKEKAGTELRKLQQSFCFKARPLPDFYKERETPKDQINKTPSTHPQPPKLGKRKPSSSSSTLQGGITSLPPVTASTKKSCFKNVFKTKSHH